MRIDRLDRAGLAALEAAVRGGEPVRLGRGAVPGAGMLGRGGPALDELVPLCHAVDDPALARWLPAPARPAPDRPGGALAVSVVIPTHRRRPIGLAALEAQDIETELLVLANGAYTEGVRVPWAGHGATRNVGARLARHPYVLFTVDDALPLGASFVRTLVEALLGGGHDAVYARQVPWPTSDPVTRARLRAWTPPPDPDGRPVTTPGATLDNVAALYRRSVLLADPFDNVDIAEDWRWGRRHDVAYVPAAVVAHAHPRRFGELYTRTRAIHAVRIAAGEPAAVPGLGALVTALPGVVGADAPGALGELLGQFVAGRRR
ncbi:MAG: hypothetical protein Q8P18_23260 [Pseudomonadota bacterium]|nr:hypothetical protein [Pseudomonadota bacterium]